MKNKFFLNKDYSIVVHVRVCIYIHIWTEGKVNNFDLVGSVCPGLSVGRSVGRLGGRSVGRSVFQNFLKGREVTLPCSYHRSTCYIY